MYSGKLVFAQVMNHLPMHTFRRAVHRYGGNRYVKSFPCHSQFLCMAFAQLTYRESLGSPKTRVGRVEPDRRVVCEAALGIDGPSVSLANEMVTIEGYCRLRGTLVNIILDEFRHQVLFVKTKQEIPKTGHPINYCVKFLQKAVWSLGGHERILSRRGR